MQYFCGLFSDICDFWVQESEKFRFFCSIVQNWSFRELSDVLGYSGYWKFKTVIDKAIAVANDKGMKIDEHFN